MTMKRKLVKQGAATLMVSLPSKWTKKLALEKGDEVSLEEFEGSLLVSKDATGSKRQTTITLTELTESSIRTAITNAYRSGYDMVTVNYPNEKYYQILLHAVQNNLIGFEIIKKEHTSCVIENITEPSEAQFEVLLRKIFYNIALSISGSEARLRGEHSFEDYAAIDTKVKQFDNFCRRVIIKRNLFGIQAPLFWTFLAQLIHGQRDLYHLNKYLDTLKDRPSKNAALLKICTSLKRLFDLITEAYLSETLDSLEKAHTLEKEMIYSEYYDLAQKGKDGAILAFHLTLAARNFYLATSPLMGLLLENEGKKKIE